MGGVVSPWLGSTTFTMEHSLTACWPPASTNKLTNIHHCLSGARLREHRDERDWPLPLGDLSIHQALSAILQGLAPQTLGLP